MVNLHHITSGSDSKKNGKKRCREEDLNDINSLKVKKKESEDDASLESKLSTGDECEEVPFQKCFYKMHQKTIERSKDAVTDFYTKNSIKLKGKGRKSFKPIFEFDELGLESVYLHVCKDFSRPTPIQSCCWPILSSGRDVIGIAETGSGKTLAFIIPALLHLSKRVEVEGRKKNGPFMLIISPTRELAIQSYDICSTAGKVCGLKSTVVYGGVSKHSQRIELCKGAEIVVATPGRLLDIMSEGSCDLSEVSYLVLDEADRMLDQGFEKDIREIIGATNVCRQTCLFSATWPESVRTLAHEFLTKPIRVTIGSEDLAAGSNITQKVEVIEDCKRERRLLELLNDYHKTGENRVLVFALYKKEAARIETRLRRMGWNCISIHGDKSQNLRSRAVLDFKSGEVPLLIATDVAARGLDIPDVDYVINYTFPLTIEDYIHRIGRTGRAGKCGISHTFFQEGDKSRAGELVNVLKVAGQVIPDEMNQFNLCTKKKAHKLYGAFGPKDYGQPMKEATRIVFDD